MHILIVDDDPSQIEIIKDSFQDYEHPVTFTDAFSLREYREKTAKTTPDIVILDLNLPDGKATDTLLFPPENNPYPVLIMTGQGDQRSAVEAIKSGALDYLVKSGDTLVNMPHHVDRAMREWKSLQMHKWLGESLKNSQSFMKTVFNTMQGGILIIDPKTRQIIETNDYTLKLIGAPREKVIGSVCHKYVCPREMGKCPICDLGQKVDGLENVLLKSDGGTVPILKTATFATLNGKECVLEHFVDITERKRSEQIANQAQKMEVVGRMASGVAHDFNNLLTVILGNCSFLREDIPDGDPKRVEVENIRRAAAQGAGFVKQLLAFSRRQVSQAKPLDVNAIAAEMEKLLLTMIGKSIKFSTSLARDLAAVKADAGNIEQIIMNLVVNARDAMPDGGSIAITTSNTKVTATLPPERKGGDEVPPGDYALLKVSDNGSGMDEKILARIFEPFFTTKEEGKGTGLGLATVHDIVKKSGGYIKVESAPGKGTVFSIYLPALPAAQVEAPAPTVTAGAKASYSVLLVEDDEDLRQITARILRTAGYSVTEAPNAKEALSHALDSFDLLLIDIFLPDILGMELAGRLMAGKTHGQVVFTSAFVEKPETREILSDPKKLFLQKPFSREALLEITAKALSTASMRPD
jgi:signal transduction histidine kinase/DNA-binding response OmpR family regulator